MKPLQCKYATPPDITSLSLISHIIFVTLLLINLLVPLPQGYKILEFQDSQTANLTPYDIETYGDGTILIQLTSSYNLSCVEPVLYFRIIHPNGTRSSISVRTSEIPSFNFCTININGIFRYYIQAYPLAYGFIFITYVNSSDSSTAAVYGLLTSFNEDVISNTYLHEASVDRNGVVQPPGSIYYSKYKDNVGFLYVGIQQNTGHIMWSHFTTPNLENNFSITLVKGDLIYNDGGSSVAVKFSGFPSFSGGFCLVVSRVYGREQLYSIVSSNSSSSPNLSTNITVEDPVDVRLKVTASFISNSAGITTHSLIYSNPFPDLDVFMMSCNVDYGGGGNMCQLAIKLIQEIYAKEITNANDAQINSLIYGGYLLTVRMLTIQYVYGYILGSADVINNWTLPQPMLIPPNPHAFDLLPNDTIVSLVMNDTTNEIMLVSSDLTAQNSTGPYSNPQINSTYPKVNAQIPLRASRINITYQDPVSLSTQNVSIFRPIDEADLLRQTYSGQSNLCELSEDQRTVTITVFDSTFNEPNTKYYVVIDPNFVVVNASNEPLLGIPKGIWIMWTDESVTEPHSDSLSILLRLSPEGTRYFQNLSSTDQSTFFTSICSELTHIIPTEEDRLLSLNRYQYETTSNKIIFAILITAASNISKGSSYYLSEDLNTMIIMKDFTALSKTINASFLDATYGAVRKDDLWNLYKDGIIGFASGLALFALMLFIARHKNNQVQNSVIFKFALLLLSFCFNVIFIFTNSRDVQALYIPSLSIIIIAFVLEGISGTFLLIRDANTNSQFHDWFQDHIFVVIIFTIFSGADIYALRVLSSRLYGLKVFSAPYSGKTLKYLLWIEIFSFFIKDLPQFIIQILYITWTLNYNIIPLITLMITSAIILFNIIQVLYHLSVWCIRRKHQSSSVGVRNIANDYNEHSKYSTTPSDNDKNYSVRYWTTGREVESVARKDEDVRKITYRDVVDEGAKLRETSTGKMMIVQVGEGANVKPLSSDVITTKTPLLEDGAVIGTMGKKVSIETTMVEGEEAIIETTMVEGEEVTIETTVMEGEEATIETTVEGEETTIER
ncbi:553_t:CDS:10 [Acaulospora morrowiae]|uniref:553_t:CDS:1 n=1 Tax=Acaulospora morrowiae TaxID=94023 RepID=A0A9N9FDX2_9GLOM|nr:553_t:CDS:10 [Acaulospora morrowiae]